MIDPMFEAYQEFNRMTMYPLEMTLREAFEAGYKAAWNDRDGEWEDGYNHGLDEGRYEGIEE